MAAETCTLMKRTTPTASARINFQLAGDAQDELEDMITMIAPNDTGALDDIWTYDGSGGTPDNRPDFVKRDDEEWSKP